MRAALRFHVYPLIFGCCRTVERDQHAFSSEDIGAVLLPMLNSYATRKAKASAAVASQFGLLEAFEKDRLGSALPA